ncbi:MAG TPA: type II toxin-antitoxin system RelE/ParE family toxin [Methylococcaceae bacterium]|nr:type II toxin-antitoxin system RelE/ParE family toxin [Methylococcaceae bacterium]
MLKLDMTADALSFLESLPGKQFNQVVGKLFALLENPEPHDSAALKGYPYRRADSGEYRIVYDIQADVLRVVLIGKRNDDAVYKRLARK